jgi:hypothetical protein
MKISTLYSEKNDTGLLSLILLMKKNLLNQDENVNVCVQAHLYSPHGDLKTDIQPGLFRVDIFPLYLLNFVKKSSKP